MFGISPGLPTVHTGMTRVVDFPRALFRPQDGEHGTDGSFDVTTDPHSITSAHCEKEVGYRWYKVGDNTSNREIVSEHSTEEKELIHAHQQLEYKQLGDSDNSSIAHNPPHHKGQTHIVYGGDKSADRPSYARMHERLIHPR